MQTKGIVAVSVVAALVAVTIMALVTRIFMARAKHTTNDDKYATDGKAKQARQPSQISNWKRLVKRKQDQNRSHWVPSFSSIIKAGDEGLITSSLFTNLDGRPGEPLLEALYDAFANELQARSAAERSAYPGEVTKFLARTKRPAATIGRSKSVSHTRRTETSLKTHRKSLDLSVMEMGLARGLSVKKPAAVLVPMRNGLEDEGGYKSAQQSWIKDGQTAKYQDGNMTVEITPTELAALSILLGSQVNVVPPPQDPGAYGISIFVKPAGSYKSSITLHPHKLTPSQQHASGSGVSPLFAKHIFCGSLPYTQDKLGVHSILIDNETFEAILTGASLSTHPYVARTPQSRYLESLPNSREPRFHILATSTETNNSDTLLDAIAALPFSVGLVPLASAPLIETVRFVASAGLSPARLLQRLEGLVDKVHRHSPHLNIFGPLYEPQHAGLLYRERERLGKLANDPSIADTLADKAARMSRYATLLQRLMALVVDVKSLDVLNAVQEATKLELHRSYSQAVAAHASTTTSATPLATIHTPTHPETRSTTSAQPSLLRSTRSSLGFAMSSSSSKEFPTENLARQVEHVLKSNLPLDITSIAFVSKMVLVAWTLSVQRVTWEGEGDCQWKVEDTEDLEGKWGQLSMC
jgi:hypothetical protein